ncbi:MAG: hypothetical protein KF768_14065 [Phycisphaeraceae bacterium]|nr:hypothetical protein [Phycisphaeraceae bacterium]
MTRAAAGGLHMAYRRSGGGGGSGVRVRRLEALAAAWLAPAGPRWPVCECCAGLGLGAGGADAAACGGTWRPAGKALILEDAGGRSFGTCYGCGRTVLAELVPIGPGVWRAARAERALLPL